MKFFTSTDVGRFCSVDAKSLHNWANAGKIVHFRTPGRHLRFKPSDVKAFLEQYGYPIPAVVITEAAAQEAEEKAAESKEAP